VLHLRQGRFQKLNRTAFAVPALVLFVSLVVWGALVPPAEEQRLEGKVVAARAANCGPEKSRACTGTLTLATGKTRRTIKVPLGTPIIAGCQALSLGELPGREVVVTKVDRLRGPVATAISTPNGPAHGAC
jgi:hypothetical protein